MCCLQIFKPFSDECALFSNVFQKIFINDVKDCTSRRTSQRIAAKSSAMRSCKPFIHVFGFSDDGTERDPVCNCFGRRENVRLNAIIVFGKKITRSAVAGLNLVKNQQNTVLIADFTQFFNKTLRCRQIAAFALNRFDHHAGDSFRQNQIRKNFMYGI